MRQLRRKAANVFRASLKPCFAKFLKISMGPLASAQTMAKTVNSQQRRAISASDGGTLFWYPVIEGNNISSSAHGVAGLLLEGNLLIILKNCRKSWVRSVICRRGRRMIRFRLNAEVQVKFDHEGTHSSRCHPTEQCRFRRGTRRVVMAIDHCADAPGWLGGLRSSPLCGASR